MKPNIAVFGIPMGCGAGISGGVMGPAALRTAGIVEHFRELGHCVKDYSDIAPDTVEEIIMPADHKARCRHLLEVTGWVRAIERETYARLEDKLPIALGGDHALSMGTVAGVARRCRERNKRLMVLWLDAHADYNTPATTPSGNMHGMSVAHFCGEPSLRALSGREDFCAVAHENVMIIGLRSVDKKEKKLIRDKGIHTIDMRMIDEQGMFEVVRGFIDGHLTPDTHLHVSLDVDFIDPLYAPGVGTAVAGGASYREAHLVMEMLHETGCVGSLDIVELNPFLDVRGQSALVLAELAASLFGKEITAPRPRRVERLF